MAACFAIAGMTACPVRAFSVADADAIFKSYNDAFYFMEGDKGYYRATTVGGKTRFWDRAEQMEMVLDVYERTTNTDCLLMFNRIYQGFVADHGTNWMGNEFNDDIMWMVIACARAHQLTGNTGYRDVAKENFDLCFARAWSTNLGGGLWWKISNLTKNSCVNCPAAIAAYLLYQAGGDTNYLTKAENLYRWERSALFDASTGQVYDNIESNGDKDERSFSYNQGTFIGMANFLGHTNEAILAADYTKNELCRGGILPGYKESGDAGGFNGICARWLARFMKARGLQSRYQSWLQNNADIAWENRRTSDNLSWSRWNHPTPEGLLYSWSCSSSVVMLQVVPPNASAVSNSSPKNTGVDQGEKLKSERTSGALRSWPVNSSPEAVGKRVAVRFEADLPAVPFRTDEWPRSR
ncbi:MAG TPA: glycoside hydrolase family 76 protein [Verrucomicrobiae bacterium]|nr:glycoside hydrolase family 76 protein [Verrucomicrobiae bacterium]